MKKNALLLIAALGFLQANSQFYYSDIISNQIANSNYLSLKNSKIKKIIITNVPASNSGKEQDGVTIQQTFLNSWASLKTETNLSVGQKSNSTTTYDNNRIIKKEDEAKNVNSVVYYEYNSAGKLASILSASEDTAVSKGFTEKHIWLYDDKGQPSKMFKVKNGIDTTTIIFLKDEQNNIAEERWMKAGKIIETYYYYYNDKNLLTDIVKFNLKVERMLPEFLFDYDTNNRVLKMTQIPFGSDNYVVWHYSYNDKGLKQAEFCYSKKGELLGQMEYTYEQ
ncbi:MAG: hypothetical protein ACOVO1_03850 [Chitinophagaceae bacterium]